MFGNKIVAYAYGLSTNISLNKDKLKTNAIFEQKKKRKETFIMKNNWKPESENH